MKETKASRAFDKSYDAAFKQQASGVQFNVMDLARVRAHVYALILEGKLMPDAMDDVIAKFRQN